MAASYIQQSEIDALQESDLSRETPFLIKCVSLGFFSIARYYGGATYNGQEYTYIHATDELIRNDVLKWITKLRKPSKRKAKQ